MADYRRGNAGTFPACLPAASDLRLSPSSLPFLGEKTVKATVQSCLFNERNSFSHLATLKEGREIAGLGASTKQGGDPPPHLMDDKTGKTCIPSPMLSRPSYQGPSTFVSEIEPGFQGILLLGHPYKGRLPYFSGLE